MFEILQLGKRLITPNGKPYVIAEIGVNHEGSVDQAKRLIDLAAEGGADAAKFQSYKADTLASKNSPYYWDLKKESIRSQHELFKKYDNFNPSDYINLANHCNNVGIDFLSTPFDDSAVDFLDSLIPFYKIASADITNIPFLRKVAGKGKPVVLSTGASTLGEIDGAIKQIEQSGCKNLALLHCILNYPTENSNAALRMIRGLSRAYPNTMIGYSDHTLPNNFMTALITAHLLGAVIIEKHFTNDKTLPGNDHYHAMDKADLKNFLKLVDEVHELMGADDHKAPLCSEGVARENARRSIVLKTDVISGTKLDAEMLTYKRPGTGISPIHWDEIIGRTISHSLKADHILEWRDLV